MIALCFYAPTRTGEKMNAKTVGIVIISGVIIVANLFSMIAPCFNCSDKLKYKGKGEKKPNKDVNEFFYKIKDEEVKQDVDVIHVKDALDTALIENKQNNEYNNNNEITEAKNYQEHTDETAKNDFKESIDNTNSNSNTMSDFGKVFGVNKSDASNIKKEE